MPSKERQAREKRRLRRQHDLEYEPEQRRARLSSASHPQKVVAILYRREQVKYVWSQSVQRKSTEGDTKYVS